jgi:hypothetical protein
MRLHSYYIDFKITIFITIQIGHPSSEPFHKVHLIRGQTVADNGLVSADIDERCGVKCLDYNR